MSSDESATEDGGRIYHVARKPWRANAVKVMLHDLDSVHLSLRATTANRLKHGNLPHIRRDSQIKESLRGPVSGLPTNFYNTDWLAALSEEDWDDFQIVDKYYDLSVSDAIAR